MSQIDSIVPRARITIAALLMIGSTALPHAMAAQQQPKPAAATTAYGSFEAGAKYVGVHAWTGGVLGGAIPIGVHAEYGLSKPGEYGPGMVGLGVTADYFNFGSFSILPVTVMGNYHFLIEDNRRLDPYIGLGLGFYGGSYYNSISASTMFLVSDVGVRYFVGPKLAIDAQAGAGFGSLRVGATWKL